MGKILKGFNRNVITAYIRYKNTQIVRISEYIFVEDVDIIANSEKNLQDWTSMKEKQWR